MKKYWHVLQLTWNEYVAYRFNFILEVVGGVFQTLITAVVWLAIFSYQKETLLAGYTLPQMMTYVFGGGVISSFLLLSSQGDDINDDIHFGALSHLLVRPLQPNLYWLLRDLCRKCITFFIGVFIFLFLFIFFHNTLLLPVSFSAFLFVLLFVFMAALIHFLLFYEFSIMAFWFEQTWGMRTLLRVIMEVASGVLIPITFFSSFFQKIFFFLPIKFFVFVPMQIYLGHFTWRDLTFSFIEACLWVLLLFGVGFFLWKKGLRSYTAAGL